MNTKHALRRLDDYQARLLADLDKAEALLAGEPAAVRAGLARVRWTMMRTLLEYKLFKHGEIFDPAIACGSELLAAAAARMKAACLAIGERYRAHVARWSEADVGAQWPHYRAAALGMAADMRAHVARERREIAALLAGSERTRRLGR